MDKFDEEKEFASKSKFKGTFGKGPRKGIPRAFPRGFCMFGWAWIFRGPGGEGAKSTVAIILAVGPPPFRHTESTEEGKGEATITATITGPVMWD